MPPRYSIVIPAWNGGKYLQACIDSIISQDYDDYELIISDDHSTDGSKEYLSTLLAHPNINVIEPEESLSMTEHWEWALSHATGTWQIFVGQDDGLQPCFFKLADKLTKIANVNNIRTITSQRAYYFWPGCEPLYGDISVEYSENDKIGIHNSFYEAIKALFGIHLYFELPEMYTTSLFHRSILNEARLKQSGRVLTCHPQDANLSVIACSLDKRYLKSGVPLGWVGTSPKSAGMAIIAQSESFSNEEAESLKNLRNDYTRKINKSKFKYNELAGHFSFGDIPLYFWQAFLETPLLRPQKINKLLKSCFFKYIFFSCMRIRLWSGKGNPQKAEQFKQILDKNRSHVFVVNTISIGIFIIVMIVKIIYFPFRVGRRFCALFFNSSTRVHFNRSAHPEMTMEKASEIILEKMNVDILES